LAVPGSIQTLLAEDRDPLLIEDARTAVFYSISNCQKGLAGISFGNLLIKQVAAELLQELPQLSSFVTLSPIPGFLRWLEAADPEAANTQRSGGDGAADLAAYYLKDAKRPDGSPMDPVARFHLGNGAAIHEVHAQADTSDKGRAQSAGVMVNYLYDLSQTEQNHEAFALQQAVAASKSIQAKARAGQSRLKPTDSGK
jgi:malonyl-CoA decarboxylase